LLPSNLFSYLARTKNKSDRRLKNFSRYSLSSCSFFNAISLLSVLLDKVLHMFKSRDDSEPEGTIKFLIGWSFWSILFIIFSNSATSSSFILGLLPEVLDMSEPATNIYRWIFLSISLFSSLFVL